MVCPIVDTLPTPGSCIEKNFAPRNYPPLNILQNSISTHRDLLYLVSDFIVAAQPSSSQAKPRLGDTKLDEK